MNQPRHTSGKFGSNKATAPACRTQQEFRDEFLRLFSKQDLAHLKTWLMDIASDPKHPQRFKAIVEAIDRSTGSDAVIALPETPQFTPLEENEE